MKKAIFLFLVFLHCQAQSQKPKNEFAFEKKVSKEFKKKELNKCSNLKRCIANNKEFPSSNFYDGFHFVDFDLDGKLDIIANVECGGSESMSIEFIRNNGNSYETVYSNYGKVINLHLDSSSKKLAFTKWQYPCCADNQNVYEEMMPIIKRGKPSFKAVSVDCWIDGTVIPEQIDSSAKQAYETNLETYMLRATPAIDDTIQLSEDDETKGNVIAAYPKHSICIKLAELTDKDGKVWWFVKMRNNLNSNKNRISRGDDKTTYNSFGWLSSKFLKKLN